LLLSFSLPLTLTARLDRVLRAFHPYYTKISFNRRRLKSSFSPSPVLPLGSKNRLLNHDLEFWTYLIAKDDHKTSFWTFLTDIEPAVWTLTGNPVHHWTYTTITWSNSDSPN